MKLLCHWQGFSTMDSMWVVLFVYVLCLFDNWFFQSSVVCFVLSFLWNNALLMCLRVWKMGYVFCSFKKWRKQAYIYWHVNSNMLAINSLENVLCFPRFFSLCPVVLDITLLTVWQCLWLHYLHCCVYTLQQIWVLSPPMFTISSHDWYTHNELRLVAAPASLQQLQLNPTQIHSSHCSRGTLFTAFSLWILALMSQSCWMGVRLERERDNSKNNRSKKLPLSRYLR